LASLARRSGESVEGISDSDRSTKRHGFLKLIKSMDESIMLLSKQLEALPTVL